MSTPDPTRIPVVVGVGQSIERTDVVSSRDLMERAAWQALDDAPGLGNRISRVVSVSVVNDDHPRPATAVARRLGLDLDAVTCETTFVGGNTPQLLVNQVASAIVRGDDRAVLLVGSEALASKKRGTIDADPDDDLRQGEDAKVGSDRFGLGPAETAIHLFLPIHVYPLFESAMAARAGRTFDEQRRFVAGFMARNTAVAATHPYAWFPTEATPEELATVTNDNRLTAEPYTKRMNAIMAVDQGAALALCSLATAQELGIADRVAFVWAGADVNDVWCPAQRPDLSRSPGIEVAGARALSAAGVGIDDIDHLDIYSCFPSAVQAGAEALGVAIDDPRGLTVTGGLAYFGGPGNNYTMHAIATTVGLLRDGGGLGLCTGLGWFTTKHSVGIYGAEPPPQGYQPTDLSAEQAAIDATEREVALDASGPATVVASTVIYDRSGTPSNVPVFADLPDGRRVAANAVAEEVSGLAGQNLVGEKIALTGDTPPTYRVG
jgi:acetyl-CoA C-acetyltransferase